MADTVLTDEQAEKAIGATIGDLNERVDRLEEAVGVLMGFVKTVLPADFGRYMRRELKLARRPESKKELKV